MKIILKLSTAILLVLGCHQPKKVENNTEATPLTLRHIDSSRVIQSEEEKIKQSILDSILHKLEFSSEQIRRSTIIDSIYLLPNSSFSGDTVYHFNKQYSMALINYNDGSLCLYKFLLIYRSNDLVNTDYKIVETDCDEDYSSNYRKRSFKILNDTSFSINEVFYERLPNKKTDTTVTTQLCVINGRGKIKVKEENTP